MYVFYFFCWIQLLLKRKFWKGIEKCLGLKFCGDECERAKDRYWEKEIKEKDIKERS